MAETQRVALVTGGGHGIGGACSTRLAASGFRVAVAGRDATRVQQTAEAIRRAGGTAEPFSLDVTRETSVHAVFAEVRSQLGPISLLVNNAGVAGSASLQKTSLEEFRRILDVNLIGTFLCAREALGDMQAASWGRIINIASTAARTGFKYTSAYCASKHAVLGLTRSLALEVAAKGITVNAVCPGWTDTEMLGASAQRIHLTTGVSEEAARATLAAMNPMKRLIQPAEVAEMVAYLASDAAGVITGQALGIDAGEVL